MAARGVTGRSDLADLLAGRDLSAFRAGTSPLPREVHVTPGRAAALAALGPEVLALSGRRSGADARRRRCGGAGTGKVLLDLGKRGRVGLRRQMREQPRVPIRTSAPIVARCELPRLGLSAEGCGAAMGAFIAGWRALRSAIGAAPRWP